MYHYIKRKRHLGYSCPMGPLGQARSDGGWAGMACCAYRAMPLRATGLGMACWAACRIVLA